MPHLYICPLPSDLVMIVLYVGFDIQGPIPLVLQHVIVSFVGVYYFTKWIKVEIMSKVTSERVM